MHITGISLLLILYTGFPVPDFLYPFGEDVGDTRLPPTDDGSSMAIYLDVPIVFYGKSEFLAFVR